MIPFFSFAQMIKSAQINLNSSPQKFIYEIELTKQEESFSKTRTV